MTDDSEFLAIVEEAVTEGIVGVLAGLADLLERYPSADAVQLLRATADQLERNAASA